MTAIKYLKLTFKNEAVVELHNITLLDIYGVHLYITYAVDHIQFKTDKFDHQSIKQMYAEF